MVEVLPNMICSFLHFGQRILMNLLVDSLLAIVFGSSRRFKSLLKKNRAHCAVVACGEAGDAPCGMPSRATNEVS